MKQTYSKLILYVHTYMYYVGTNVLYIHSLYYFCPFLVFPMIAVSNLQYLVWINWNKIMYSLYIQCWMVYLQYCDPIDGLLWHHQMFFINKYVPLRQTVNRLWINYRVFQVIFIYRSDDYWWYIAHLKPYQIPHTWCAKLIILISANKKQAKIVCETLIFSKLNNNFCNVRANIKLNEKECKKQWSWQTVQIYSTPNHQLSGEEKQHSARLSRLENQHRESI